MESLHTTVPEEIALEGLDGITLDSKLLEKIGCGVVCLYILLFRSTLGEIISAAKS